jgi:polyhydroxyalkanoate synthesis regulator phasin
MYTIKRYANGRFYDTEEKTFIRREQIAGMIAAKKAFVILDTKTGKDVTEEVRTQILAKEEGGKAHRAKSSRKADTGEDTARPEAEEEEAPDSLFDLLRKSGDTLYQWGKKYAARGQDLLTESWKELDKRINRLVAERKISASEGRDMKNEIFRHSENLRNWMAGRVEEVIGRMNPATKEEFQALNEKIDALEERVKRLEENR